MVARILVVTNSVLFIYVKLIVNAKRYIEEKKETYINSLLS
jgi:hypothetical protein